MEKLTQLPSTVPLGKDDKTRRAYLLNVVLMAFLLAAGLVLLISLFTDSIPAPVSIVTGIYVLFLMGLQLISRSGKIDLASKLVVFSSVIGITFVVIGTGTIRTPGVVFYPFTCIVAGWLIGRRAAAITAVIVSIIILSFVYAEINQLLPTPNLTVTISQGFILIIAIVVTVLLFNIASSEIDDAMMRLHEELNARKQAEKALRESEERFRIISSVTSDYTFSSRIDIDGNLEHILLTGAFQTITGYTNEEFLEKGGWRSTLHPDDIDEDERAMLALNRNESTHSEVRIIRKDGSVRWVRVSAKPIWDTKKNQLVGINGGVQDITDRKELEEQLKQYNAELERVVGKRTRALQRAKEQIELIINNTSDAILFADAQGNVLLTNPAFHQGFGGTSIHSIERILDLLADKDQVTLLSNAILEAINRKIPLNTIVQVQSMKDSSIRDIDLALIPINSIDEDLHDGILLSGRDITQQREIERFKERFVANALHDLATPISALDTRIYILKRSPQKLEAHISVLQNQVQHMKHLLEDLRTLSQIDRAQIELDLTQEDLNLLVKRVHDTYEHIALEKQQTLKLNLDPVLPPIELDVPRMERVLVNLIGNAINYTPEDNEITIQTKVSGQFLDCHIIDNGIGIGVDDLPRIFERFYRTDTARKNHKGGTGLGLAITKEIIELHGGTVSVDSKLGQGSTFSFSLPIGIEP